MKRHYTHDSREGSARCFGGQTPALGWKRAGKEGSIISELSSRRISREELAN